MSERNPSASRRVPVSVFLTISSAVFAIFVAAFSTLLDKEWDTFKEFLLPYVGIKTEEVKTIPPEPPDLALDDNGKIQTVSKKVEGSYSQATTRLLTRSELVSIPLFELKIMRNEIFARHGYIFETTDMKNHFSSQPWYQPRFSDVSHLLTPIERENIKLIQQYESITKKETVPSNLQRIEGSYPQATTRLLTRSELVSIPLFELKIMRNEIFARHGYIFETTDMKNHFSSQPWYQPRFSDVSHLLTPIERENIKLIKRYEK